VGALEGCAETRFFATAGLIDGIETYSHFIAVTFVPPLRFAGPTKSRLSGSEFPQKMNDSPPGVVDFQCECDSFAL
jgi:hypothetical protein